jgi:hypothetical protein
MIACFRLLILLDGGFGLSSILYADLLCAFTVLLRSLNMFFPAFLYAWLTWLNLNYIHLASAESASMAASFALVDATTANTRQTDDALNGVAGGCAAGFLAGIRRMFPSNQNSTFPAHDRPLSAA